MRSFANPFPDYVDNGAEVIIEKEFIKKLIQDYVRKILSSSVGDASDLYTGSSGIAFMFLKLNQQEETRALFPTSLQKAKLFIDHAKKYVGKKDQQDKAMFLCGNAGVYAVSTIINKELNDAKSQQEDLNNFLSGYPVCKNVNYCRYGSDEVLFGRAGYLSGIYYLNQHLPKSQHISQEIISKICDVTIKSGIQYSKKKNLKIPMMWECYGDKYLGAAHGICAILHMMLESPPHQTSVKSCIDVFLQMQSPDGNFPCSLEDAEKKDYTLVHWCHGGPGAVYLFAKAYLIFKEQKYLDSCLKIGDLVWKKGLLKKGPGICHGVAGNGYVFLILYRLTNDQKHLYRASCFAKFLMREEFIREARTPDKPLSLYEGVAGTVCYLVDLLNPAKAQFPFMDVFELKC